jgi:hypothetical protein
VGGARTGWVEATNRVIRVSALVQAELLHRATDRAEPEQVYDGNSRRGGRHDSVSSVILGQAFGRTMFAHHTHL